MKRDMDLIRKLTIRIEEIGEYVSNEQIQIEGYSARQIAYHCALLHEAGLIAGKTIPLGDNNVEVRIERLTWAGHDFVDVARNDTVWNTVTTKVKDSATTMTFDGLKSLLKQAGHQAVKHGTDWLMTTDWSWIILQ